jgi:ribulose-phosphate 3-epimerase
MKVRRRTTSGIAWKPHIGRWSPGKLLGRLSGGRDRLIYLGSFVGFLIVGYLIAAVALFPAPIFTASTTVPDLVGLTEEAAVDLLEGRALAPGDIESVNHAAAPPGQIVWHDPPPGIVVTEGTTVQLSVSQGPRLIPVPDVANYTGELAALLIESAGLEVRIDSILTAAPRGIAVNTRPATGSPRRPGDTIRLLVSVGAPTIEVPNLLGLTLEQAEDTLETLDLGMGAFTTGNSRTQEPGTIFQQDPPAGTLAAPGTRITGWVVRQRPAMDTIRIAPSILSADLLKLADQVAEVEAAGADWIHIDVMDGRFVPNLTFGASMIAAVRRITDLPLDVHLMVVEPERYIESFAEAGASVFTFHPEATVHVQRHLGAARGLGMRAGLALNPSTPLSAVEEIVDDIDLLLIMSVNPGYPAQSYIAAVTDKLRRARAILDGRGSAAFLEVDGGISPQTIGAAHAAGADTFVAGSAIFSVSDPGSVIGELRERCREGVRV